MNSVCFVFFKGLSGNFLRRGGNKNFQLETLSLYGRPLPEGGVCRVCPLLPPPPPPQQKILVMAPILLGVCIYYYLCFILKHSFHSAIEYFRFQFNRTKCKYFQSILHIKQQSQLLDLKHHSCKSSLFSCF